MSGEEQRRRRRVRPAHVVAITLAIMAVAAAALLAAPCAVRVERGTVEVERPGPVAVVVAVSNPSPLPRRGVVHLTAYKDARPVGGGSAEVVVPPLSTITLPVVVEVREPGVVSIGARVLPAYGG